MCIIGEEKFSRGLAVYFERFAWSNTILDDFIEVMQEQFVSELFTLDQWKEQWIEVACHNTLEASWQHDSQH
jgi:aminopeptidase N